MARESAFSGEPSRALRIVRGFVVATLVIHIAFGALSAHRAYFQVRGLTLSAPSATLHAGDTVRSAIVSSARNAVTLLVELAQETRAETLAVRLVPKNANPFWDPRSRAESVAVTLSPAQLQRFHAGPVQLRATGIGRGEWFRVPPPVVRSIDAILAPRP